MWLESACLFFNSVCSLTAAFFAFCVRRKSSEDDQADLALSVGIELGADEVVRMQADRYRRREQN